MTLVELSTAVLNVKMKHGRGNRVSKMSNPLSYVTRDAISNTTTCIRLQNLQFHHIKMTDVHFTENHVYTKITELNAF